MALCLSVCSSVRRKAVLRLDGLEASLDLSHAELYRNSANPQICMVVYKLLNTFIRQQGKKTDRETEIYNDI